MFSGRLLGRSLYLRPMMSLPAGCGGVSCSVRLRGEFLSVSWGLRRRGVRPAPILKTFLFVLQQGSTDGVLDQSPAHPQELRLVGLRPATPTWVEQAQEDLMRNNHKNWSRDQRRSVVWLHQHECKTWNHRPTSNAIPLLL